jgi:hypothetical protein
VFLLTPEQNIMKLLQNIELAYCTNVHRGSTWEETFHALDKYVLKVKKLVCPMNDLQLDLDLSANAAKSLANPKLFQSFNIGYTIMTVMFLRSMDSPMEIFMANV